jgi:hypothetical protein
VPEVKAAETADAEKALLEESRVAKTPERVEEEVIVIEVVGETSDLRQNNEAVKIESEDIALKDCKTYLRNNTDLRKHMVACIMSRK